MKTIQRAAAFIAMFCVIIAMLITSFQIAIYGDPDYRFYQKEYEKYQVTESLYMDMEDVMKLMSWIHHNRPEMKRVDYGFFSWHKDKPPKVVYDRTALVQGCIYNCWLREAGCKEIEGGEE